MMNNDKLKNLLVRTASGVVLIVVFYTAVVWSQWSLGALLLLLLLGGMLECYALVRKQGGHPQSVIGVAAGAVLFALSFALTVGCDRTWFACGGAFLLLSLPLMFLCELWRKGANPAADIGTTLTGVIYVALPFALLLHFPYIATDDRSPWVLLAYVAIVWSNDVFAYLTGMLLGRHPLFPRLSPKKSWEGFCGGLAGAVCAGCCAARLLGGGVPAWAGLALLAALTAVAGDLVESMFKRAAGVKDSGSLIPGHGGVLDRFDAMLLSAPFVFVYLLFVM